MLSPIRVICSMVGLIGGVCAVAVPVSLSVDKGRAKLSDSITPGSQVTTENTTAMVQCSTKLPNLESLDPNDSSYSCWTSESTVKSAEIVSALASVALEADNSWSNLDKNNWLAYCRQEDEESQEVDSSSLWELKSSGSCNGVKYIGKKNNSSWSFLKREGGTSTQTKSISICESNCWEKGGEKGDGKLQQWAKEKQGSWIKLKFQRQKS